MSPNPTDSPTSEPSRDEIGALPGAVLLEFGASWCPHCQALAPEVERQLRDYPAVRHIKIEDGPGRRLGRSFRVKLWPNLVFLRDGEVMLQLARPPVDALRAGFEAITSPG